MSPEPQLDALRQRKRGPRPEITEMFQLNGWRDGDHQTCRRKQLEVEQLPSCFYEVVLQTCANIATFSRAKDEIIFAAIF